MKRKIVAAEAADNGLDEALDNLKADFDYILSGLEKLGRSGANASNDALAIAETISNALTDFTNQIASAVSE